MHRHNIYPIVLLLKFRHHKQIREVCESHHPSAERISQKEAKEMYELAAKMEQEYKHVISGKGEGVGLQEGRRGGEKEEVLGG